jgi:hypothetical protein
MQEACEMTICATVGIDVSKDRLDVVLRRQEREQARGYANSVAGFRDLHTWLHGQGVAPQQTQVALEATGSYSDAVPCSCTSRAMWSVCSILPYWSIIARV